jgi:hypothetical protein
MHQFYKIISNPVIVLAIDANMRAVLACLLAAQILRMLSIPLFLKFILGDDAMTVEAVATRRAVEDLAPTLGTPMMSTSGEALVEKSHSG